MEESIEFDEVKDKIKEYQSMVRKTKSDADNSSFIRCIDSVIMKLNVQNENDKELIQILEDAKFLPFGLYDKKIIEAKMNKLKHLMRQTLKNEWERVKKEVQKGGLVNGKRKNIFDCVAFAGTYIVDCLFTCTIFLMILNKVITDGPGIIASLTVFVISLFQIALLSEIEKKSKKER